MDEWEIKPIYVQKSSTRNDAGETEPVHAKTVHGVGVIVLNERGEVLCGVRSDTGEVGGPGGHIEPGETPAAAAIRETQKEFGITTLNLKPLGQLKGLEQQYGEPHIFLCTAYDGEPKCKDGEMSKPYWLDTKGRVASSVFDRMFPPFAGSLKMLAADETYKEIISKRDEALVNSGFEGKKHFTNDDKNDIINKRTDADADDDQWITINGTHIKLGENGELTGKVGKKISDTSNAPENPSAAVSPAPTPTPTAPPTPSSSTMSLITPSTIQAASATPSVTTTPKNPAVKSYGATDTSEAGTDDSLRKHTDASGQLTAEREQLHQSIIDETFGDAKPPIGQPVFTVMGGGPASGKSSLLDAGLLAPPEGNVTIDSDAIKGKLPEYGEMISKGGADADNAARYAHEESSALAKRMLKIANDDGFNYTLDGTGDGSVKSLTKKLEDARNAGMRIEGHYITIPTNEAIKRAEIRAAGSGRKVFPEVVTDIHRKVSQILPQTAHLFDSVKLYDNGGSGPVLIATGGNGKGLTPEPGMEKLYNDFLDKAK